ncbi:MAG: rhombosortase [Endozoicomonas sp.]
MEYQRSLIEQGEYWRLITGHFVHVGPEHLVVNLLGVLLILLLNGRMLAGGFGIAAVLSLSLWVSAGLWFFNPEVKGYSGLSGVLYGLFVLAVLKQQLYTPLWKTILVLLACLRVALEQTSQFDTREIGLNVGVPVVYDAHLYGLTGGLLAALFMNRALRLASPRLDNRPE